MDRKASVGVHVAGCRQSIRGTISDLCVNSGHLVQISGSRVPVPLRKFGSSVAVNSRGVTVSVRPGHAGGAVYMCPFSSFYVWKLALILSVVIRSCLVCADRFY